MGGRQGRNKQQPGAKAPVIALLRPIPRHVEGQTHAKYQNNHKDSAKTLPPWDYTVHTTVSDRRARHQPPPRGPPMKYLSPLLSDARASIGGATASKNRAGNYFRERIAPVQPRTPAQQAIRAGLATLSAQWRALTASQIAAWNALATQVVKKDSLGNSYTLTGEQLYVGNNQSLTLNSQANVSTPPASPPSFPGPMLLAAAASAGGATFTLDSGLLAAPAGYVFEVRATPQLSAGISFVGASRYRFIDSLADSTFASLNIHAAYIAKFGALTLGSTIGLGLSLVEVATGFKSLVANLVIKVAV